MKLTSSVWADAAKSGYLVMQVRESCWVDGVASHTLSSAKEEGVLEALDRYTLKLYWRL